MIRRVSRSAEETAELGAAYAATLRPGEVVGLTGELGSGKTVFVAGICSGLGLPEGVSSPTFTLINEYRGAGTPVAHIDLYRINRREELAELGLEEYFREPWVCLVEWAERAGDLLPPRARRVTFEHGGTANERYVTIDVGEER